MANYDSGVTYDSGVRYDEPSTPPTTMSQNKISAVLAAQAVTNINTALVTIRTNLPFLVSLTKEERRKLPRVNEASQGVVLAALNFVNQNPQALPGNFSAAEFVKDGNLITPLTQVAAAIAQLNEDVDDTVMVTFNDLYAQFLDVYAIAKAGNRNGAYDSFIDSVKGRFARSSQTPPTPPPGP